MKTNHGTDMQRHLEMQSRIYGAGWNLLTEFEQRMMARQSLEVEKSFQPKKH